MKKHNWDKQELNKLYHIEGKTLEEIGTLYEVSRERIRQVMEEYNLPRATNRFGGREGIKRKRTFTYHSLHEYANSTGKRQSSSVLWRFIKSTVCNECGASLNLHLHHITYPAQNLNDLQVLCASCHFIKHRKGITFAKQLDIYNLYNKGVTAIELASQYNVGHKYIYKIINKIKNGDRILRR